MDARTDPRANQLFRRIVENDVKAPAPASPALNPALNIAFERADRLRETLRFAVKRVTDAADRAQGATPETNDQADKRISTPGTLGQLADTLSDMQDDLERLHNQINRIDSII